MWVSLGVGPLRGDVCVFMLLPTHPDSGIPTDFYIQNVWETLLPELEPWAGESLCEARTPCSFRRASAATLSLLGLNQYVQSRFMSPSFCLFAFAVNSSFTFLIKFDH